MTADTGNGTGPRGGPPSWPWVARPAGWFLSPQEPGHEGQPEGAGEVGGEWFVAGQDEPQSYWYEDDGQEEPGEQHVVGPTAALNGLPGGPGFAVPPAAVAGPADERSPWAQAEGVWRGSGIAWEQPEVAEDDAGPVGGAAIQVPPAFGGRQGRGFSQPNSALSAPTMADSPLLPTRTEPAYDGQPPPTRAEELYDGQPPPTRAEPTYDGQPPPTHAEELYDGQEGWGGRPSRRVYRVTWASEPRTETGTAEPRTETGTAEPRTARAAGPRMGAGAAEPRTRAGQDEPRWGAGGFEPRSAAGADERDQIFEVWRNQQMRYPDLPSARARIRRGPRRRPVALTALKVGVPVFVIVAVGVGAVMMLTGKTKMVLAERGDTTTVPRAGAGAAGGSTTPAANANTPAMAVFAATLPGYQGRGVTGELVEGLASGNGTQLAVGTVDGLPAVWRRAANGSWSLVTQNTAGITSRAAILTTVVRGPGGWVAVGAVGNNAAPHPVVLVSADGQTWQFVDGENAFGYPGAYAYGATAGRAGYLVVGKIVHAGRTFAATWRSTDLYHWVRDASNGGLDGRLLPSQMLAAAATPGGFIAVGQHGSKPAVWMTATARDWKEMDLPMPAGATSAALMRVVASGERLVALGDASTSKGIVPFAATSGDGGASWREVPLATPGGGTAAVTAVTATASGFTAAAQAGGNDAIYWTSADGTAWSAPRQAGSGIAAITGLIPAGGAMAGIGESPAGRPVIWAAG